MNEEIKTKLIISVILFKNNVPIKEAKQIGSYIEKLEQENQQLKQKLQQRDNIINKVREKIKLLGKFDGKTCTRGFQMWVADFNQLLEILNIDKGDE